MLSTAHLSGYESRLPAEYSHSAEWRAILKRAEEAVWKVQNGWRYKWAGRWKDDRKKRELEAAAINRACGRDARRLHEKMMTARETARADWGGGTVWIPRTQRYRLTAEGLCVALAYHRTQARVLGPVLSAILDGGVHHPTT